MGVPVFFKWMCMRNPKMLKDASEPDADSPMSSNPQVDKFYVDMNGLIHPSVNPKDENIRVPQNFEEQCQNIFVYIDKIMNIVRPRKLVYLAIDGVAPRAKMNQQRSRRFRAAMEGAENNQKKLQLLEHYRQKYKDVSDIQEYVNKKSFDSNMITPGTTFLCSVADRIRDYIKRKMATDRLWKNIAVVFSDASCPGEGEHKIMEFIRQQRASETYDPNQIHCIYGADADLIMLGLATHEPRFYIIREVVVTANDKWCTQCGKKGHYFTDCRPATSIQNQQEQADKINAQNVNVQFQYLNLKLVRQFLHVQFMRTRVPYGYDLERIIDDFVFLCFFVGNDFLPHVPCLTIRQGGIDMLLRVYDYCLALMPDYITKEGEVQLSSLKVFINQMKIHQKDIISQIIYKEEQGKAKEQRMKQQKRNAEKMDREKGIVKIPEEVPFIDVLTTFKNQVKGLTTQETNLENYSIFSHEIYNYKEKYYREKFRISPEDFMSLRRQISVKYVEALSWINKYYYKGVASWSWYYPFHYSPFFSDIFIQDVPQFQQGEPFRPFEQLMAVLPPKTCDALPTFMHPLMLEESSPISDYFPSSFEIDLVGKKFAWLGEVLLPFIDEHRLLAAMGDYHNKLNQDEASRNKLGIDSVYVSKYGPMGKLLYNNQQRVCATYEGYKIEGQLKLVHKDENLTEWHFWQPKGRRHDIHLKEGIAFSLLEDLDDEFARRLDKRSYSGDRFIRVIERSLGQRMNHFYRQRSRGRGRGQERNDREDHSRSRDNRRDDRSRDYRDNREDRRDYRDDRRDNRRQYDDKRQYDDRRGRDRQYPDRNRN